MIKIRYGLLIVLAVLCLVGKAQNPNSSNGQSENEVWVRYEPVKGVGQQIRLKDADGSTVRIENLYKLADRSSFIKLKRRGCATFWYDMVHSDTAQHEIVKARTKKNSLGVTASYLLYGTFSKHYNWLDEKYTDNFTNASFVMRDYSVGLNIGRQLFAKNRHRISFELFPSYRRMNQIFSADQYRTSYPAKDPDNSDYERLITISNYQETQRKQIVCLPLDFRYDLYFLKKISLFVAAGVENDFTILEKSDVQFDATYAGKYGEELFGVIIDQNGYYDYGTFANNHFENQEPKKLKYTLYGMATAGLQLFLGKTLSLELAGVYHRMIYTSIEENVPDVYCLSASNDRYQSMQYCMKPAANHRIGGVVRIKFSF